MTQIEKTPSEELMNLISKFTDSFVDLFGLWESVKEKGGMEGFSEKELQDLVRPLLTKHFGKHKVWYLFHREEQKERSKSNYEKRTKLVPIAPKKDTEQSDSQTPYIPSENRDVRKATEVMPDLNEDEETFVDALANKEIDIKNHPVVQRLQHDLELERQEKTQWKGKFEQLGEVEAKRSFVSAKDEMNHISGQSTIIMLIMELQKRRNEWKRVKYLVEVVT